MNRDGALVDDDHPLVSSKLSMTVRFIRSSHDDDLSLVVRTGYLNQVCGFIFFVQGGPESGQWFDLT